MSIKSISGVIVLLVLLVQNAVGATYYVDVAGNDGTGNGSISNPWKTLRFAVTKVSANQGYVIKLSAGTFIEAGLIEVPLGVSIEGSGKDITILKASPSFYYYPATPGYATDKFLISLNEYNQLNGNQHLKNFTIDGDGKKLHGGIWVKNRNFVLIESVKVTGTNFTGIWLWDVKDSRITNTDLINCSWGNTGYQVGALNIGNLERVEIDHCYIDEDTGYGIKAIGPSGYNNLFYLKIHDCTVTVNPVGLWNNGSAPNIAIELWMADPLGAEIYNCYVDNTISLINANANPSTGNQTIRVHHNVFDMETRAKGAGYPLELTIHDAEVDHNYFLKGNFGITNWDNPMKNWDIHHNIFYAIQGTYPGEVVRSQWSGLHNVNFYNNTIEFDSDKTASVIGLYGGTSENINIKNNLFINSNTTYSYYPNQFIYTENNASLSNLVVANNMFFKLPIGSVAGTYANNITSDPMINKTAIRPDPYYLPNPGSPLIDAGVNVGFPYTNLAPDIGAFEYGGTIPVNIFPVVNITAPAINSTYTSGSSLSITANASDIDGSISKVEFFNGTIKLGEDLSSPYSYVWANLQPGAFSLTAKATDDKGAVSTSLPIPITVSNGNTSPSVSINSPSNNTSFTAGSSVTISAIASDADGSISKVEFFNGAVKLGEDLSSPYSYVWASVPAGTFSLTAKATDNNGAFSTSSPVSIVVSNGNASPNVSIISPSNNASFIAGGTVTISANASDADGSISKVEFFNGATKLGEASASPYSFVWTNVPAGTLYLTAKATDNNGAVTTSASVFITINNVDTAPIVTILTPANNAILNAGATIAINVNASDNNGSISKVEFFSDAIKLGEDLSSPYGFVWVNASSGTLSLIVIATDNTGNTTTAQVQVFVATPNLNPVADAGKDVTINLPVDSLTLYGSGIDPDGNIAEYSWTQNSGPAVSYFLVNSSDRNIHIDGLTEGVYLFELMVTDNLGATAKDQIAITVLPPNERPNLKFPRFFSPNNDGVNDKWEWEDLQALRDARLIIFNRFGQKVYETISYQNNWDGTLNGKSLEEDAYFFIVRGRNIKYNGAVRIIK